MAFERDDLSHWGYLGSSRLFFFVNRGRSVVSLRQTLNSDDSRSPYRGAVNCFRVAIRSISMFGGHVRKWRGKELCTMYFLKWYVANFLQTTYTRASAGRPVLSRYLLNLAWSHPPLTPSLMSTAKAARRAKFEGVYHTIRDVLMEDCQRQGFPPEALEWYHKVLMITPPSRPDSDCPCAEPRVQCTRR